MSPSRKRRWIFLALSAAIALTVAVSIDRKPKAPQVAVAPVSAPSTAPPAAPAQGQAEIAIGEAVPAQTQPARDGTRVQPAAEGTVPPAIVPPASAPPSRPPAAADQAIEATPVQPVEIMVTATAQATRGGTIEVAVSVPPGVPVHAGRFEVGYDPEALEPLEAVDAAGTAFPLAVSGSGSVAVDFDTRQGAMQALSFRFLVNAVTPQSTLITVTGQAWDDAGTAVATGTPTVHAVLIWP